MWRDKSASDQYEDLPAAYLLSESHKTICCNYEEVSFMQEIEAFDRPAGALGNTLQRESGELGWADR